MEDVFDRIKSEREIQNHSRDPPDDAKAREKDVF